MRLLLVHQDQRLADAWRENFADQPNVSIVKDDLCKVRCDAVVCPAFSFGALDAEAGAELEERFGGAPRQQFAQIVRDAFGDDLPVGQSVIVPTGDGEVPWLIVAPTMTASEGVRLDAAYGAMKAVLLLATGKALNPPIETLAVPPLRVSSIPVEIIALQMWKAYHEVVVGGVYRGTCYCRHPEDDNGYNRKHGIPPGFCSLCDICRQPGHMRHHPGGVPYTGGWCDEHYDEIVDQMREEGHVL